MTVSSNKTNKNQNDHKQNHNEIIPMNIKTTNFGAYYFYLTFCQNAQKQKSQSWQKIKVHDSIKQ